MAAACAAGELRALAGGAGGAPGLLLVAERGAGEAPRRALLEGLARELGGGPGPGGAGGVRVASARPRGLRRWASCGLAVVVLRGAGGGAGRGARALVRDVRGQVAPGAALVAVLVREEGAGEAARLRLEALLRGGARAGARREALQAALYSPAGPHGARPVRDAALRALRAARQLQTDGMETKKPRLPAFLRCFSWCRRSEETASCISKPADASGDDGLQETEEGVALTDLAPNGNCEEACGISGT